VPVMITAPSVIGASLKRIFGTQSGVLAGLRRKNTAVAPDGTRIEIPEDANSVAKYMGTDGSGLVKTEKDGVTIVSRQAAE
jgi:multidrug efflux pump